MQDYVGKSIKESKLEQITDNEIINDLRFGMAGATETFFTNFAGLQDIPHIGIGVMAALAGKTIYRSLAKLFNKARSATYSALSQVITVLGTGLSIEAIQASAVGDSTLVDLALTGFGGLIYWTANRHYNEKAY